MKEQCEASRGVAAKTGGVRTKPRGFCVVGAVRLGVRKGTDCNEKKRVFLFSHV